MPYKIIDQCTDDLGEHDDENPDYFVVSGARLLSGAVHQHPDPKCETGQEEQENTKYEKCL